MTRLYQSYDYTVTLTVFSTDYDITDKVKDLPSIQRKINDYNIQDNNDITIILDNTNSYFVSSDSTGLLDNAFYESLFKIEVQDIDGNEKIIYKGVAIPSSIIVIDDSIVQVQINDYMQYQLDKPYNPTGLYKNMNRCLRADKYIENILDNASINNSITVNFTSKNVLDEIVADTILQGMTDESGKIKGFVQTQIYDNKQGFLFTRGNSLYGGIFDITNEQFGITEIKNYGQEIGSPLKMQIYDTDDTQYYDSRIFLGDVSGGSIRSMLLIPSLKEVTWTSWGEIVMGDIVDGDKAVDKIYEEDITFDFTNGSIVINNTYQLYIKAWASPVNSLFIQMEFLPDQLSLSTSKNTNVWTSRSRTFWAMGQSVDFLYYGAMSLTNNYTFFGDYNIIETGAGIDSDGAGTDTAYVIWQATAPMQLSADVAVCMGFRGRYSDNLRVGQVYITGGAPYYTVAYDTTVHLTTSDDYKFTIDGMHGEYVAGDNNTYFYYIFYDPKSDDLDIYDFYYDNTTSQWLFETAGPGISVVSWGGLYQRDNAPKMRNMITYKSRNPLYIECPYSTSDDDKRLRFFRGNTIDMDTTLIDIPDSQVATKHSVMNSNFLCSSESAPTSSITDSIYFFNLYNYYFEQHPIFNVTQDNYITYHNGVKRIAPNIFSIMRITNNKTRATQYPTINLTHYDSIFDAVSGLCVATSHFAKYDYATNTISIDSSDNFSSASDDIDADFVVSEQLYPYSNNMFKKFTAKMEGNEYTIGSKDGGCYEKQFNSSLGETTLYYALEEYRKIYAISNYYYVIELSYIDLDKDLLQKVSYNGKEFWINYIEYNLQSNKTVIGLFPSENEYEEYELYTNTELSSYSYKDAEVSISENINGNVETMYYPVVSTSAGDKYIEYTIETTDTCVPVAIDVSPYKFSKIQFKEDGGDFKTYYTSTNLINSDSSKKFYLRFYFDTTVDFISYAKVLFKKI